MLENNDTLVYLGGPITGVSYDDAVAWRSYVSEKLTGMTGKVRCISPLRGKEYLKDEKSLEKSYEEHPLSTAKAIVLRDGWDVDRCDIVLFNFMGSKKVSIGSVWELGRAVARGHMVTLCMEKDNVHNHPMLTQNALVCNSLDEAILMIQKLV